MAYSKRSGRFGTHSILHMSPTPVFQKRGQTFRFAAKATGVPSPALAEVSHMRNVLESEKITSAQGELNSVIQGTYHSVIPGDRRNNRTQDSLVFRRANWAPGTATVAQGSLRTPVNRGFPPPESVETEEDPGHSAAERQPFKGMKVAMVRSAMKHGT